MNVSGYQDFINKFGSDNVNHFQPLKSCAEILGKICNCQRQRKAIKAEECNNTYISIITTLTNDLNEYFKTKTHDNEIIFYHNSVHKIKSIKLR